MNELWCATGAVIGICLGMGQISADVILTAVLVASSIRYYRYKDEKKP